MAAGYFGKPILTEDVFLARIKGAETSCSFLRTGDLAFFEGEEGFLFICGRIKDLIIINGANVYPQDVEKAVQDSTPAVKPGRVVAFSEDDRSKSGNLIVILELRKGNDPSMACEVVQKAVCASVGVQPSRLVAISEGEICKALNGKIQRRATRDALLGGTLNIVHEQVCDLVDFKSVEEPSTVELGVELQETEQLPISSPVCITDGVDSTETPSLLQSDALKIALNYEVRENLVLNILTKIAQSISGKCVNTHAPLMEFGFDSLALAELAVRVQEEVVVPAGIRLEVITMDMYELTTLHAIAQRLIESGGVK